MIKTIQAVYFSPTKTTKKTVEAIVEGTRLEKCSDIDLTLKKNRDNWDGSLTGDVIVLGTPVYSSTLPGVYQTVLKKLIGKGKIAVAICVYGHVKYGDCLNYFKYILEQSDLNVIAGGCFLGEHSFNSQKLLLAEDRPDKEDITEAQKFGKIIVDKINKSEKSGKKLKPIKVKGKKPKEQINGRPLKLFPSIPNTETCTKCKLCVQNCPMDCINEETLENDLDVCIQCMQCVKICPEHAREIIYNLTEEWIQNFHSNDEPRKNPETWI